MTNQDFKRAFTAILYKYVRNVYYVSQSFKGRFKPFKGTVLRDAYFFEGLNFLISTSCVCADGFQDLSKAFHNPIQCLTFYLLL